MWLKVDTADNHWSWSLWYPDAVLSVRTTELWGFCFKILYWFHAYSSMYSFFPQYFFPLSFCSMCFEQVAFNFLSFLLFLLLELLFKIWNLRPTNELTLRKLYLLGQTQWAKVHVLGPSWGENLPRQHDNINSCMTHTYLYSENILLQTVSEKVIELSRENPKSIIDIMSYCMTEKKPLGNLGYLIKQT